VAPLTVSEPLGVRRSTVMLRVRALHVADERPYVLEDRWVNVQSVPEFEQADLAQVSANEWLLAHVPVSEAELTVAAERCGAADAPKRVHFFHIYGYTRLYFVYRPSSLWRFNIEIQNSVFFFLHGERALFLFLIVKIIGVFLNILRR
jgi:hypothetical protein